MNVEEQQKLQNNKAYKSNSYATMFCCGTNDDAKGV